MRDIGTAALIIGFTLTVIYLLGFVLWVLIRNHTQGDARIAATLLSASFLLQLLSTLSSMGFIPVSMQPFFGLLAIVSLLCLIGGSYWQYRSVVKKSS